MGRPRGSKNKETPLSDFEQQQAAQVPLDSINERQEEEFLSFVDSVGDGSVTSVAISRINPLNRGKREYLNTVPSENLRGVGAMDFLRDNYGPGEYRLQFKNAAGVFVEGGNFIVILGRLKGEEDMTETRRAKPGEPATSTADFLREQLAQQQTLIMGLIAAIKPAPAVDMGSMLQGIAQLMPKQQTTDPALMFSSMATAFAAIMPKPAESGGLGGMVEIVKSIVGLAKEMQPGSSSEEETSFTSVLKDVAVEVTKGIMTGQAAAQRPAVTVTPERPRQIAAGETEAQPEPAPPAGDQEMFQKYIKEYLVFLKEKARKGKDPEAWIDYTLDNSEEPGCAAILVALDKGAQWEHLLAFEPEINTDPQLNQWFRRFYDGLQAERAEVAGENGRENRDSDGAAGDTANAGKDGGVNPGGRRG